jgi:tetratricopeptide (TPR) repeat protein
MLRAASMPSALKKTQSGAYKTALAQFESILSDILARYGEHHDRVGAALHNVAIANLRAGSLDDAMDAIEEAIKIRSRSLGRSHPKVAVRSSKRRVICSTCALSVDTRLSHRFLRLVPLE